MGDLTIVNLPSEIQLTILELLDIQSLLSIRQVRQSVFYFSYIKSKFCSDVQEYLPTYT